VPRGLNFIEHKADSEAHHVVVLDQNLLQSTNAEISFSSGHREKPEAFELFKGTYVDRTLSPGSPVPVGNQHICFFLHPRLFAK
jgi:hypothetical protein